MREMSTFRSMLRWGSIAAFPILLAGCASGPTKYQRAEPARDEARMQMRDGNYHAAAANYSKAIEIDPESSWTHSELGDALILQTGDIHVASQYYAKSWILELQNDYDLSKGDPLWLKTMLFVATVGAAAGTDYYNAKSGTQSNTVRGGLDTYQRMGLESATGTKDFRKVVKAAINDLKEVSSDAQSSIQVCKTTGWPVPCKGMYRLVTASKICPIVRTDVGVFAAPLKCLDGDVSDFLRIDGSGMNEDHYYPLLECFTDSGGASCDSDGSDSYAFLASKNKSTERPSWRSGPLTKHLLISDKIVAVSYDALFGRIVPVITSCEAWVPDSLRCARPSKDWSVVYMRQSQPIGEGWIIGDWFFAGFLSPEGKFVSQSSKSRAASDAKRLHEERVSK